MHPIEQLRYVARASGADATLLVEEAASALRMFADEPNALLAGAKSLVARQPGVGPLWWMASKLIAAPDGRAAVREVIEELRNDPTPGLVDDAMPSGSTVVIVGWPDTVMRTLVGRPDVEVLVIDVEGQGHGAVRRLDRADVVAEAVDPVRISGAVGQADLVLVEAGAMGPSSAVTDLGGATLAAVAHLTHTPALLVAAVGRRLPEPYWQELVVRIEDPRLPGYLAPFEVVPAAWFSRVAGPPEDCPMLPELLRPVR